MLQYLFIYSILFIAVNAIFNGQKFNEQKYPNPNNMDMNCVMKHCGAKMIKAALHPSFYKLINCENGCTPYFYNETAVEKFQYQNCTTKCALTYQSKDGDDFMACTFTNQCVTFAPLDVKCPNPEVEKGSSLADLHGEWWQQYGYNKLFDCYNCQHIHDSQLVNDEKFCAQTISPTGPVKAPCYSYTYSYDLFLEKGTKNFKQTWQLPKIPKGKQIDIYYEYMGSMHNETWFILQTTQRYVVLVDCSYMSGWTNVGGIVWVRPQVKLTSSEMADIKKVFKQKLNWNFPQDFCVDKHDTDSVCQNKSTQDLQRLFLQKQ